MARKVYLVDLEYVKQFSLINMNIDAKKLRPIVLRVQRNRVEPVLGTTLYEKILTDVEGGTVTGLYKEMLDDFVLPMMLAYIEHKYTFHSTSQMTNKTTGRNEDQHIEDNSVDENDNLRAEVKKDAKQEEGKLIGFLKDNFRKIPELCDVPTDKLHQSIRPQGEDNDTMSHILIV